MEGILLENLEKWQKHRIKLEVEITLTYINDNNRVSMF